MTIFSSRPRKVFLSPGLVWLEEGGWCLGAGPWCGGGGEEGDEDGNGGLEDHGHGGEDCVEKEGQGGGDQLKDAYSSYFSLSNCSFVLLYEKMKMNSMISTPPKNTSTPLLLTGAYQWSTWVFDLFLNY